MQSHDEMSVSNLFDPEHQRALCSLNKQARTLGTASFRGMRLDLRADLSAPTGTLPPPRWVFILDDGRALAWFGKDTPYVVHPSFSDLCHMHGVPGAQVHAA